MDKSAQLLGLARLRQSRAYEGYKNLADYASGVYECDYVSPYTKTAGNVDADVMFILQDWSSDDQLSRPVGESDNDDIERGFDSNVRTNINLEKLLSIHFQISFPDTYGTNLFPFIKPGRMNAEIPSKDYEMAAADFAIPQIDIVAPKLVICLGQTVIDAIRKSLGEQIMDTHAQSIDSPFDYGTIRIWAQAHPGYWGIRNRGGFDRVSDDWSRMADEFRALLA